LKKSLEGGWGCGPVHCCWLGVGLDDLNDVFLTSKESPLIYVFYGSFSPSASYPSC
jgi:hypothetical protein